MGWNNAAKSKEFKREQKKMEEICHKCGMDKVSIEKMKKYDLEVFNSDRRFYEHIQSIDVPTDDIEVEMRSPLLQKFLEAVSVTDKPDEEKLFWWFDEIEDERIVSTIQDLSMSRKLIIHYLVYEGYTGEEIAEIMGWSKSKVFYQLNIAFNKIAKAIGKPFDFR